MGVEGSGDDSMMGLFGQGGQPSGGLGYREVGGQDTSEDDVVRSFLGGRAPSEVPRGEKMMLMKKALADAQMASEMKRMMMANRSGRGLSGGDMPMLDRMVGGDFWSDFGNGFMSVINPVLDIAGKVAPLLAAGQPSGGDHYSGYGVNPIYSRQGRGLSGGAIEDSYLYGSPPVTRYDSNTPITGGGQPSGGQSNMNQLQKAIMMNNQLAQGMGQPSGGQADRMIGGMYNKAAYPNSEMSAMGQPSGGFDFGALFNKAKGLADKGLGYARQGCKVIGNGQPSGGAAGRQLLLKPMMYGTSMTGAGTSGGDQADLDYMPSLNETSEDSAGKGQPSGGKRKASARNAIVSKVMRDKGMKLVEASKYVKAHNLYKK